MINKFCEPTLLLNSAVCKQNIQRMADRVKTFGGNFRPHFKTHQSAEIGEWFRLEGVDCITVSSFKMAFYFAEHGWKDITVAITATELHEEMINKLAGMVNLSIIVEDIHTICYLEQHIKNPVGVFIKIDTGYHRTGVDADDLFEIKKLLEELKQAKNLIFIGFITHGGNTYVARGSEEIKSIASSSLQKFLALKVFLKDDFPLMQLSWGDTPSCSVVENFYGIDEFRPGNFVFYDYMQYLIGSCNLENIAVCLSAPVIAIHKDRNEVVVHAGAVHLSKEYVKNEEGRLIYGAVVSLENNKWSTENILGEVVSLSQEHGVISMKEEFMHTVQVRDVVGILPVHSCLTVNLMKKFYTLEGNLIQTMQ